MYGVQNGSTNKTSYHDFGLHRMLCNMLPFSPSRLRSPRCRSGGSIAARGKHLCRHLPVVTDSVVVCLFSGTQLSISIIGASIKIGGGQVLSCIRVLYTLSEVVRVMTSVWKKTRNRQRLGKSRKYTNYLDIRLHVILVIRRNGNFWHIKMSVI